MKNIKNRIYFDSWRKVNEPLFSAYISCYNKLSKDNTLDPAEELIKSLDDFGILGKVKKEAYGSAYIPARELGIFYNNDEGNIVLGENAKKFIRGDITYVEYMKHYVLNYKALINNKIITPFQIVRDHSLLNFKEKSSNEIFEDCKEWFSDGTQDNLASDATALFMERALEAGLLIKQEKKYKIFDKSIYDLSFADTGLTSDEFQKKFLGGSRQAQENYVKEMINKPQTGISNSKKMNHPLNQILFGPPGTGKTYSTITKALDIIGVEYESYEEAQELFQNELGKRIEFVTMHQSFSYEDFVQGLKPKPSSDKQGVEFHYKRGIFMKICRRAERYPENDRIETEANSVQVKGGNFISFEDLFENIKLKIKSEGLLRVKRNQSYFQIKKIDGDSMKCYTKDGKGKEYTMNKMTLKDFYDDPKYSMSGNNSAYYRAIIDHFTTSSENNITKAGINKTTYKPVNRNHVIILDEINRCNVSKVFGELITLIEDDKREHIYTRLPSGKSFTVPKNLYIIGTMNTADKSISMVDIALRRRFEFKPLYPDLDLVTDQKKKEFMELINEEIKERKTIDFQIGHSDFMKDLSLVDTINRKTIPLLMEYFRNNVEDIEKIISKCLPEGFKVDEDWLKKMGLLKVKKI